MSARPIYLGDETPDGESLSAEYVAEYECQECGMLCEDVDAANDHTEIFGRAHLCPRIKR